MHNKLFLVFMVFICLVFAIVGCGKGNPSLKTDSGKVYKDVPQEVITQVDQTTIIHLAIRVVQSQLTAQYQVAPAQGESFHYNNYGSSSYVGQIIEGKGILLVEIINGPEEYLGTAILKFVDLKAMALQSGFVARVSCVIDYELLNPAKTNAVYTNDALTYELDDCRLDTPFVTLDNQ